MNAPVLKIPFCWEERRPCLLDHLLYVPNPYDKHEAWHPVSWDTLFGNDNPVYLEYCSGNGQWICEKAKEHPENNWVALDLRFDRCRKTWKRLHREKLANLYILCGDARILTRYYIPKKSISKIFINFPDPWPKRRHAKHRLTQEPFLQDMAEVLLDRGVVTFVTDDFAYKEEMQEALSKSPNWEALVNSLNPPDYGPSFFSDLWKKRGRDIYLMQYEYEHCPSL